MVCGRRSRLIHKPRASAVIFDGMGVDRIRELLAAAKSVLKLTCPQGSAVCSSGRYCYRDLRDELLVAEAYRKRRRQTPISEGDMLRAAVGGCLIAHGAVRRVASVQSEVLLLAPPHSPSPPPPPPRRTCGTPGCDQADHHDGPCAVMMASPGASRLRHAALAPSEGHVQMPIDPADLPKDDPVLPASPRIGRKYQIRVPAWPHATLNTRPHENAAATTALLERGDEHVTLQELQDEHALSQLSQRIAFNARVLKAEPRRRWSDAGALRVALGSTHAHDLLAYVCSPNSRDGCNRLRLDDGSGIVLNGYGNYLATHAVEAGSRHSQTEQVGHTFNLTHQVLDQARRGLPGLDALVDGALRQLPETMADGRALVPLHGHILNQESPTACFSDHQDTEEEVAPGGRDRRVVFTVVLALSSGGNTAMRVLGQPELAFTAVAGSGVVFRSELWHRTERAVPGVWKLALFYGYMLKTTSPRVKQSKSL